MAVVLWPRVFKEERCRKLKLNHIGTFFLEINKLSHQFRLQQNKKVPIVDSFKLVPCDYQSTYCNLNSTNWAPSLDYNKIKKIPIVDSFKLVPCDYQSTYCNKLIATWRQFSGIRQAISKQSRAELTNEVHNIDSFTLLLSEKKLTHRKAASCKVLLQEGRESSSPLPSCVRYLGNFRYILIPNININFMI